MTCYSSIIWFTLFTLTFLYQLHTVHSTWEDFDITGALDFAAPLTILDQYDYLLGLDDAKTLYSTMVTCMAVSVSDEVSYLFAISTDGSGISTIQDAQVSYRYDVSLGPKCSLITDTYEQNGHCVCDALLEVQDTSPFGCQSRYLGPSQLVKRKASRQFIPKYVIARQAKRYSH